MIRYIIKIYINGEIIAGEVLNINYSSRIDNNVTKVKEYNNKKIF